jgi:hypothetical protein
LQSQMQAKRNGYGQKAHPHGVLSDELFDLGNSLSHGREV